MSNAVKINPYKMEGYKVVYQIPYNSGVLLSCNHGVRQAQMAVRYIPNEIAHATIGRLFAFSNLIDAQAFSLLTNMSNESLQVWRAELYGVTKANIRLFDDYVCLEKNTLSFWNWYEKKRRHLKGLNYTEIEELASRVIGSLSRVVPSGTLFCRGIKLVEKIS